MPPNPSSGLTRICLVLNYRVPSLNALFSMSHWQRHRERKKAHLALLSALQVGAGNYSTQTTLQEAANMLWMAYDTLASYLTTQQRTSGSKRARKKCKRSAMSARTS